MKIEGGCFLPFQGEEATSARDLFRELRSARKELNPAFYGATQLLLAYLAIDRVPATMDDVV